MGTIFFSSILFVYLFCGSLGYAFSDESVRTQSQLACEGFEIQLRCPGNDIISIQGAAYGRQDDMTCVVNEDEMQDMHCQLPNAKEIVAERCNGNTSCAFMVGDEVFDDPCPGTKKYLNIGYECVPYIIPCPGKLLSVQLPVRKTTNLEDNAVWMKDPFQISDRLFFMAYTQYTTPRLFEYEYVNDMKGRRPAAFHRMPENIDGTGMVVYDRSVFYNPEGSRDIVRYDLSTRHIEARRTLHGANYGNTSPYGIGLSTDIDLAVDKNGLWAIYATESNNGNIVISRLKHHNLDVIKTWETRYDKLSALNTFMVCGVLYMVNYKTLTIDHMFNTTSNVGTEINIRIPGLRNKTSSIKYNPKEKKLYVWDYGVAVTYQLNFTPFPGSTHTPSRSTTTTTPTTPTPSISIVTSTTKIHPPKPSPIKLCPSVMAGGTRWPASRQGIVKVRCPAPSFGNAIWICAGNASHPKWTDEKPDFGQCVSEWIQDIQKQLDDGVGSAADVSQNYFRELEKHINANTRMSTWDIIKSIELQRAILNKATNQRENAANLMGFILKSASLLLKSDLRDTWLSLSPMMQNNMSSELVTVVEDAAFFLAYDMSIAMSRPLKPGSLKTTPEPAAQNKLNWSEDMVSLAIRVEPITQQPQSGHHEKIKWLVGQKDIVKLDTEAVLSAARDYTSGIATPTSANETVTRHLAVVLLSFRHLGQYMKDIDLPVSDPVDSKVLSVSAASIRRVTVRVETPGSSSREKETSVLVNRHQNMNLRQPLTMTFTHTNPGKAYHECAYWDYKDRNTLGRWWRKGCRAIVKNFTHTVCECDHMTSFAVLSSDATFPSMGSDSDSSGPSTMAPLEKERDLPVLRAGLCISLLFLVVVAITLLPLSASRCLQSDINTIHKNLIVSLIVTEVVFLIGIDQNMVPVLCGVVAGLLHLGLLAVFTWAALEAYHLMVILGDVTDRRDRWRWYYIVGYGAPIIVVAASAAADHTGYGTGVVCWLKTDGSFIWSFIGPCCFAILCCVIFLSITMYRLHLYYSDSTKQKSVRSGVSRSCLLMFLLCALWSCGVLWLSNFQPRATAILFCILSSLYGMAAFFLHCILPSEVRKHYSSCFSRIAKNSRDHTEPFSRHRHFSDSSRHASAVSHNGTGRHDMSASLGEYYSTRTGCTTTLLPTSAAQSAVMSVDYGRCASDMDIARIQHIDNSHFAVTREGHSDGSAMELAHEQDHRDPLLHHTHPGHGEIGRWSERRYEQPLPQIPNCSTIASRASGHYNHLHEHYPSGSHHHLVLPPGCNHQRVNHHYETMDLPLCKDCPTEMGVQLQMGENGEPMAVRYSHCVDDHHQRRAVANTAPIVRSSRNSFPCCDPNREQLAATMHHGEMNPHVEYPHDHTATNRGYLTHMSQNVNAMRHGHIKMGTTDLQQNYRPDYGPPQRRSKHASYQPNRAGRSSDPLSTDQGYDTDSQQHGCRACCDSQSDNDHSCSPRPSSITKPCLVVRSVEPNVLPTITASSDLEGQSNNIIAPIPIKGVPTRANHIRSPSDESLCSENDKEVQRIISSTDKSNPSSPAGHGDNGNYDIDHTGNQNRIVAKSDHDDVIDTARGGRLSVAESVTSWCAHAGSNPRAVNSSYGKHNKGKSKKTADPKVILANAKMRENGDTPPQGRSKTYVYTLPGTAAAGTKAKIDLKHGGIAMITNL